MGLTTGTELSTRKHSRLVCAEGRYGEICQVDIQGRRPTNTGDCLLIYEREGEMLGKVFIDAALQRTGIYQSGHLLHQRRAGGCGRGHLPIHYVKVDADVKSNVDVDCRAKGNERVSR